MGCCYSTPTGRIYLIKNDGNRPFYNIEVHTDDAPYSAKSSRRIIAITNPIPVRAYHMVNNQMRCRGYDVPIIETRDERMLVDDFWAAVTIADKSC